MSQSNTDPTYQRRLDRGRRFSDLGARMHRGENWIDRKQRPQWRLAVDALALTPDEAVLDVGCGFGGSFTALRQAVGAHGRVVGLDYSKRVLTEAEAVVAEHGWANVEVRQGDASATPLEPGAYDAAIASFSLSTVPDLDAAVNHLHAALRPGGRVFVGDMHFGPHLGARLLRKLYRMTMAANGNDVTAALRSRFDTIEPVVDGEGRTLTLPQGRSWPPSTYVLARKAVH